ncbi:HGGxSTG domain-containing protein [Paucibacter sediminis]|uniref:HGGxSTG domain-containing protein n=1 Tax=Paucibacter sediminis TaxID=3019553 RepID=A0AA95NI95_9BURK|nr:HGGxSTG domain-containing protein [Paucibacter sp. S2-9]WIT11416.1 HGGxSTG domain-containing protein [Paucibacter sp. S2-9]
MTGSQKLRAIDPQAAMRQAFVAAMKAERAEVMRLLAAGVPEWEIAERMRCNPLRMDYALFAGLRCGATGKRSGKPCSLTAIYANGRCKLHGGLSTGPTSTEGKARAALNGRAPKRAKNAGNGC